MQGSLGDIMADYGFNFFEKIHGPIFLIDRCGHVRRLNEAGRKFLKIAKISALDVETFLAGQMANLFPSSMGGLKRTYVGQSHITLIARSFKDSNLILIELQK